MTELKTELLHIETHELKLTDPIVNLDLVIDGYKLLVQGLGCSIVSDVSVQTALDFVFNEQATIISSRIVRKPEINFIVPSGKNSISVILDEISGSIYERRKDENQESI